MIAILIPVAWPEEEFRLYAKYRKSLKSKTSKSKSSAPPPPPANSVPSLRGNIESRVESLSASVATLAEFVHSRLDALMASLCHPSLTQVSSQPRLGPDVRDPHLGSTAGYHHQSQALGGPDRAPAVPPIAPPSVSRGVRAPSMEQSGSASAAPPEAAPGPTPRLQLTVRLLLVLRFLRPSLRHQVGSRLALLLRAPLLTPVHLRSRRIATPRAFSCRGTRRPLAWQTSFMRSVLSLVR